MKKLVALVLVFLSLVSVTSAETIDLSGMNYDELVALRNAVNEAIMERGYEKTVAVPAGTYTVGVDIPAGTYTITIDSLIANMIIKDKNGNFVTMHAITTDAPIGKITLTDSQIVELTGGRVNFAPYAGLGF